jgi:hypothetical protein
MMSLLLRLLLWFVKGFGDSRTDERYKLGLYVCGHWASGIGHWALGMVTIYIWDIWDEGLEVNSEILQSKIQNLKSIDMGYLG